MKKNNILQRDEKGRITKNDNKPGTKKTDETLQHIFEEYIEHISNGYSKASFGLAANATIKQWCALHPDIFSIKKIEEAERLGMKHWEELLMLASSGVIKTNGVPVIFALKNKYPSEYKDRQEMKVEGGNGTIIAFGLEKSQFTNGKKADYIKKKKRSELKEVKKNIL